MSFEWDKKGISFNSEIWARFLHLLYPGAFGAVYTSASNYHRVASAIEKAGGKIYPMLAWIHSRGIGLGRKYAKYDGYQYGQQALKPAIEPIVLFQKECPDNGETALAKYGTGSLNIAGSMDITQEKWNGNEKYQHVTTPTGIWKARSPSNVLFDKGAARQVNGSNFFRSTDSWWVAIGTSLNAAERVKYSDKARREERDAGLDDLESVPVGVLNARRMATFTGPKPMGKNDHPTVKPLDLARWLGGLFLPPEQFRPLKLLNPFSGTGSDAIGAIQAGWTDVVMIEKDERYSSMCIKRLKHHTGVKLE